MQALSEVADPSAVAMSSVIQLRPFPDVLGIMVPKARRSPRRRGVSLVPKRRIEARLQGGLGSARGHGGGLKWR